MIDVGTNSVKLLIAEVADLAITPLHESSEQTRLGRGFFQDQRLRPEAIRRTAQVTAEFVATAERYGARRVRIIATSAARDAVNREELIEAIRRATALPAEVISGEQEAEWGFHGVTSDGRLKEQRLLLLDVGGGSTQCVLGEKGHHVFCESFPMGSVRLYELLQPRDPPAAEDLVKCRAWLTHFLAQRIVPQLEVSLAGARRHEARLVGTGGTSVLLARMHQRLPDYDRAAIERTVLTYEQVMEWLRLLWGQSLAQRRTIPGLPPERADVILTGLAIIEAVMAHFAFPDLYISTRGIRFGALLALE